MTLVALLALTTQAWAADTYTITFSGFGNEACNKTVTDATLEYSETFLVSDVYANYQVLNGVGGSNDYVSITSQAETQITITVKSAFEGTVNVTVYYINENGDESQSDISVTCVKSAPAITVEWDAATKTGTFTQPASDVVLTPIYAKAAAFATTGTEPDVKTLLPEAAEGVIAGTDASLIAEGTGIVAFAGTSTEVTQGTLMYAIGTSATEAPALTAFSATVPTAENVDEDGADVYVWYYIQGADAPANVAATLDNTFENTEPACLTVTVLSNKFDIQFNAANANTIEAGKATVTVGGTAATVTEGKLQGVKMGSEVKVTAKEGYKFRKVEVKKKAATPTLKDALADGATVVITYTWMGSNVTTFTYTNNGGNYTGNTTGMEAAYFANGMSKDGTTLKFTASDLDLPEANVSIDFFTDTNEYSAVKGSSFTSFTISVNGTDLTSQLTEAK